MTTLKSICAWCGTIIREAPPGAQVTHGICPPCSGWVLARATDHEGEGAPNFELGELRPPARFVPAKWNLV